MSDVKVFSSVYGGYDELRAPLVMPENVSYWCCSDASQAVPWQPMPLALIGPDAPEDPRSDPERFAKLMKHIKPLGRSVYVDGNVLVKADVRGLAHPEVTVAAFRHPQGFDCIEEALHCSEKFPHLAGDIAHDIGLAMNYFEDSAPPKAFACGIIVRNASDVAEKLSNVWQCVYCQMKSGRDQLAFAVACHVMDVEPIDLCEVTGGTLLRNKYFSIGAHKKVHAV